VITVTFGPFSRDSAGLCLNEMATRFHQTPLLALVLMPTESAALLPLHDFLAQLSAWQDDPSADRLTELRSTFERITSAYGVRGAHLTVDVPPLAPLEVGTGSLGASTSVLPSTLTEREIEIAPAVGAHALLRVDGGSPVSIDQLAEAVELSLSGVWSQREMLVQRRQLEALDLAVQGIASIGSVERVLQVIVDRVRDLIGAEYAALGIVGPFGRIEQFITSGISPELRTLLGEPPRGHGMLGLIISEDRALVVDDIATDPRRYGFPPNHPEMHSFLGVPVHTKGHSVGNLYLTNRIGRTSFTSQDRELVERFALHAGIAIENARLHEEIGRLAIVEERQRISQDLHDSIIQSLYAISLSLEDLPEVITEDPAEGAARADRAIDSIHSTIRDIRNFIMGLQPELLATTDLISGIRTLAAEFQANTMIDLELDLDERLSEPPGDRGAHVLAITREALSNIARHSGATRASIQLEADGGSLRLVIGDNGRGFDVAEEHSTNQRGLTNLRSRAEAVGGTMSLTSELGQGTRLELLIPTEGVQDPT
jgi:signal transduction histidine kinase